MLQTSLPAAVGGGLTLRYFGSVGLAGASPIGTTTPIEWSLVLRYGRKGADNTIQNGNNPYSTRRHV